MWPHWTAYEHVAQTSFVTIPRLASWMRPNKVNSFASYFASLQPDYCTTQLIFITFDRITPHRLHKSPIYNVTVVILSGVHLFYSSAIAFYHCALWFVEFCPGCFNVDRCSSIPTSSLCYDKHWNGKVLSFIYGANEVFTYLFCEPNLKWMIVNGCNTLPCYPIRGHYFHTRLVHCKVIA